LVQINSLEEFSSFINAEVVNQDEEFITFKILEREEELKVRRNVFNSS